MYIAENINVISLSTMYKVEKEAGTLIIIDCKIVKLNMYSISSYTSENRSIVLMSRSYVILWYWPVHHKGVPKVRRNRDLAIRL